MKIGLKRVNIQEEEIVKILLDSGVIGLMISLEFAKKQRFKLKKIKRPIYIRNVDGFFNNGRPIEYTVEINVYYQEHRKRMEIDVIGRQN